MFHIIQPQSTVALDAAQKYLLLARAVQVEGLNRLPLPLHRRIVIGATKDSITIHKSN